MRGLLFALASIAMSAPASAVTIHASPFITSPTNFNSFEALGPVIGADGITSHSEDGIHVEYVGGIVGGGIVSQLSWAPAVDGNFSWYPGEWGLGYTLITFADADAIQFLAKTSSSASQRLNFQLFLDGGLVASGVTDPVFSAQTSLWSTVGFSGLVFDEVRLAMPGSGVPDTTALDAIAISAVPEPLPWALWLGGAAVLGGAARRRRPRAR